MFRSVWPGANTRISPSVAAGFIRLGCVLAAAALVSTGCRSAAWHQRKADERTARLIDGVGRDKAGRTEDYVLSEPEARLREKLMIEQRLPGRGAAGGVAELSGAAEPMDMSLAEALRIGAAYSREYRTRKESIFRSALKLDVESEEFRNSWAGVVSGQYREDRSSDPARRDVGGSFQPALQRLFATGASVTTRLAFDLTRLLTLDRDTAYGILADASVTVPLLQGAGRGIVLEPLTQAERNVVYAFYDFERYKKTFAARLASDYMNVLERAQQIRNAEDNYNRLLLSTSRAERMAESGRLPATQVDQTRQDLLRARERLISSQQSHQNALDSFKLSIGLPTDALIRLDTNELVRLEGGLADLDTEDSDGTGEAVGAAPELLWRGMSSAEVVQLALTNRLDLRKMEGNLEDARRAVGVARDALRGSVKLEGGASYGGRREVGSAESGDARIRPSEGRYRAVLQWDPPWRRVRERSRYRESLLDLDKAQRDLDELEDQVKQQVRADLRGLYEAEQSRLIQARAVQLAERRVASTELFQQAGRSEIRDVLEAQEALVSARNSLISALVRCTTTEWNLMRDLEMLTVSDEGLWNGHEE